MFFLTLIACIAWFEPESAPVDRSDVSAHLTGNFRADVPEFQRIGPVHDSPQSSVQAVRFEAPKGFVVSGALWTPNDPGTVGVVVAHGHYGQGKSSPEAQEVAHRLAARGVWVLAVDSPGVEEGDTPGRQIHFAEGAHNRGALVAGGTSALAVQLSGLHSAVSVLRSLGANKVGVTGASGGAVASFYLAWLDERVGAAVLASPPPTPREAAASGCPCDHIPGHPGPDPGLMGQLQVPSLWLADVAQDKPAGLGRLADFRVMEGPHSYTEEMQRASVAFFEETLGVAQGEWLETVPQLTLSSGSFSNDDSSLTSLARGGGAAWVPNPVDTDVAQVACRGTGPVVLALGPHDPVQLAAAGLRVCAVRMPAPGNDTWDEAAWVESIGRGTVRADALVGAVQAAARAHNARAVWAHRSWALIAGAMALPFVVHEPVREPSQLAHSDPAWVHVPQAWHGVMDAQLDRALAVSMDEAPLVAALKNAANGP